jgi:hypothetical protein
MADMRGLFDYGPAVPSGEIAPISFGPVICYMGCFGERILQAPFTAPRAASKMMYDYDPSDSEAG